MNRLVWILSGVAIGAGLVLWAAPRAKAQGTPTPLGEFKREAAPTKNEPAPRIVQGNQPQQQRKNPAAQEIRARGVKCWYAYVTPETYTIQCDSGYWVTYMADGTQVMGNGLIDPNARAQGSTIGIDPATGGPSLKNNSQVTAPGNIPSEAPHQAPMWGQQPLQTR